MKQRDFKLIERTRFFDIPDRAEDVGADPVGSAEAAKSEAIQTAAADATAKAEAAKTEAISTAAEDATEKADAAKQSAEEYTDQEKADALNTASADATTKANAAEANAKTYTDENAVFKTGNQDIAGNKTFTGEFRTTGKAGFFGKAAINQPAGADQAAVTVQTAENEIGDLTISAAYDQAEVQALRDKCEQLANDVRALATLCNAQRTALVNLGILKGET